MTQLGPAVDRVYLSSSGAGYISSYEMSDRLFYAATQFFTMTFLYRRVAIWARLPTMEPDDARHLLRRDGRLLGVVVTVLTVAGMLGCLVALVSGLLPQDWTQGFWWAAVVMVSVPAHAFNVVGTRLLVVARKQHYMVGIAVTTGGMLRSGFPPTGSESSAGQPREPAGQRGQLVAAHVDLTGAFIRAGRYRGHCAGNR